MPKLSGEQQNIIAEINRAAAGVPRKLRRKFKLSAIETGLVESGLRNLSYGDADSKGWRQERTSIYGQSATNVKASVSRFRDEFLQQYNPGETAGEVAAQVQRPREDLRGRYQQAKPQARQILAQYGGMTAGQVGPAYVSSSRTVPGVDNGPLRQQLKLQYLAQSHDPNALLQLATGLKQAQDTPDRTVSTTRRVRSSGQPQGTKPRKSGDLYELFWQGPHGIDVKNGQRVAQGFVEGHTDHVHVAAGRKQVIRLGKLAQQMGLHVGENPAFGGVNPVHAEHSFHYRNEAIDVSGDPKTMAKFARRVARMYGV